MKFFVRNYSCLQNPWLGGYRPQIPVLSVLNWICWTPLRKKFLGAQHVSDINISFIRSLRLCCWITTWVVLFSVRCVLEIWCGWVWVVPVLQAEAQHNSDTRGLVFEVRSCILCNNCQLFGYRHSRERNADVARGTASLWMVPYIQIRSAFRRSLFWAVKPPCWVRR